MADDSEGDQKVPTVDDLTNEQYARLIRQAQRAFGEDAVVCRRAGVGAALGAAVHRNDRQPEEVK